MNQITDAEKLAATNVQAAIRDLHSFVNRVGSGAIKLDEDAKRALLRAAAEVKAHL